MDREVRRYNETPPRVDVNSSKGKSKMARPTAASVGTTGVTVHVIDDDGERVDWESWCSSHDCHLRRWTSADLQVGSMLQANRELLLRCSAHAGLIPNLGLEDEVIAELKAAKSMTAFALVRRIHGHDHQEVLGAIAAVILQNRVDADLIEKEFDLRTELRVRHDPNS